MVFDPATVRDDATFAEPMRRSRGVAELLVAGVSVVRAGAFVEGATPGVGYRADWPRADARAKRAKLGDAGCAECE